jgi:hypothetical protein
LKKSTYNYNEKGKLHGYHESNDSYGISGRMNYKNGNLVGYIEFHGLEFTIYCIK